MLTLEDQNNIWTPVACLSPPEQEGRDEEQGKKEVRRNTVHRKRRSRYPSQSTLNGGEAKTSAVWAALCKPPL